jgi:hypothetical protein
LPIVRTCTRDQLAIRDDTPVLSLRFAVLAKAGNHVGIGAACNSPTGRHSSMLGQHMLTRAERGHKLPLAFKIGQETGYICPPCAGSAKFSSLATDKNNRVVVICRYIAQLFVR